VTGPLRIAVLTSLFPSPPRPREGVFAQRRWEHMAARGHGVRVVQPTPFAPPLLVRGPRADARAMPREELRGGLSVQRPRYLHLPGRALGNARRFARVGVRAIERGGAVDAVVCDYAWPAAVAADALAAQRVPCVINGRGSDVLEVAGEAGLAAPLAAGLRTAGHWTAVSQDLVDAMDRLANTPGRGVLVPNGVDTAAFSPGSRSDARRALGVEGDAPLVLVVGHLIARKDPLLALEAFRRGAPDDARIVFVGRGPLEDELVTAIARHGLATRARLVGEAEPATLADWYRAADALLLTSSREGRPNVVLEALSCGLPVLATPAGGTGELLETLPACLAPSRGADDLALALRRLLASPPPTAALRRAIEGLTWDAACDRLEACLEAAVQGARRP